MDHQFTTPPKGIIINQWPAHIDGIGKLSVAEFKDLPFIPKRFFIIDNVPANAERGGHAHKETQQYLFCVKGVILVLINNGKDKHQFKLIEGQGTFIDKMIWDSQKFMTGQDILLVLCSTEFKDGDYIRTMKEFLRLTKNKKYGKAK